MSSRSRRLATVALAALFVLVAVLPVAAAGPAILASDAAAPGGRLVVVWRGSAPSSLPLSGVRSLRASAVEQRSVVVAGPGRAGEVAAELRADPRVLGVVPDAVVHAFDWPADGPPSDTLYAQQGDLEQIRVPEAWPTTTGDPSVVVAVIDSGVDLAHPDLAGVKVVAPRNETFNNTDVTDVVGHGTHVAGTIFARTDNGLGIAGIAPDSALMPIKVLDGSGSGFFSDVLDAVDWARTHHADIVNLSLGGLLTSDEIALFQPTFSAARAAGMLVVAAAGNSGNRFMYYPAGLAGVVSVGAVDGEDAAADFSTFNRAVDLSAPGVDTLSTVLDADDPSGYARFSGTSMASPHVAGVAALVWAARPSLDVAELEGVLRAGATDLGDPGRDDHFGSGEVDALGALDAAVPSPLPDFDPVPGPAGPLEVTFSSPLVPIHQLSAEFSVAWTASHAIVDGELVRLEWVLAHGGRCPDPLDDIFDYVILPFESPVLDTGLRPGFCYRWEALAFDENGEFGDTVSESVTIVDHVRPRIQSRTPGPGASRVSRKASPRIVFSEPVIGASATTIRLKNLSTGRWVKARVTYDQASMTATIDPSLWMIPGRRYAVYVSTAIRDGSGNHLFGTHWAFAVRR